jgi:hypothetical protein
LSVADFCAKLKILSRLLQLEAAEEGRTPSPEEQELLDRELEDYRATSGSAVPWKDAEARLRRKQ